MFKRLQVGAYAHGRSKECSRWRTERNSSQRGPRCFVICIEKSRALRIYHAISAIECPYYCRNIGGDCGICVLSGECDKGCLSRGMGLVVCDRMVSNKLSTVSCMITHQSSTLRLWCLERRNSTSSMMCYENEECLEVSVS